jgi:hypothetical protein
MGNLAAALGRCPRISAVCARICETQRGSYADRRRRCGSGQSSSGHAGGAVASDGQFRKIAGQLEQGTPSLSCAATRGSLGRSAGYSPCRHQWCWFWPLPPSRRIAIIAAAQLHGEDQDGLQTASLAATPDALAAEAFTEASIPYGLFRIPPAELKEILPQQLYSLLALRKLDLPAWDDSILKKMGCLVGLELDPVTNLYACRWALQAQGQTEAAEALIPPLNADRVIGALGSIVASRIAREAHLGGPSFTVSAMENSGLKALELAYMAIARGEMPAALVFAVDMAGSARGRSQLATRRDAGELEISFAADTATAIVLADAAWAQARGLPILAEIDAVSLRARQPDEVLQAVHGAPYRGSATALAAVIQELHNPAWASGSSQEWEIMGSDQQVGTLRLIRRSAPFSQKTLPQGPGMTIERRDLQALSSVTEPLNESPAEYPVLPTVSTIWQQLVDHQKQVAQSHETFLRYRLEGDALLQSLLQQQPAGDVPQSVGAVFL